MTWKGISCIPRHNNFLYKMSVRRIKINQYDKERNFIKRHISISEAAHSVNGWRSDMRKAMCKDSLYKNYYWLNYEFPDLLDEIWKQHPRLNVQLSTKGRYRNNRCNEKWFGVEDRNGYYGVKIITPNQTNWQIHRLVLETFKPIDNYKEMDVDHRDGNKGNNELTNLDWVTTQENNIRYHTYQKYGLLPDAGSS